jgi:hypothetical protein
MVGCGGSVDVDSGTDVVATFDAAILACGAMGACATGEYCEVTRSAAGDETGRACRPLPSGCVANQQCDTCLSSATIMGRRDCLCLRPRDAGGPTCVVTVQR